MGEVDFESSHHTVKSFFPHLSLEGLDSSFKQKTLIFSRLQITTLLFQILNLHVLKWRKTDKLLFLINRCETWLSDTQGGKKKHKKEKPPPSPLPKNKHSQCKDGLCENRPGFHPNCHLWWCTVVLPPLNQHVSATASELYLQPILLTAIQQL